MTSRSLTIIIPVRTEAETIRDTVVRLIGAVRTPHEIHIVDDHISDTDGTKQVVLKLKRRYPQVRWIQKRQGDASGFGPALVRSVGYVRSPYTVFVMADMCDDPKTIDRMMAMAKKTGADVVCGSRYSPGGQKIGGPWIQHICSWLLNKALYDMGVTTRDATNSFKVYKTPFLRSILPARPLRGVEFSLQLSIEGFRKNGRYLDVPTTWRGRTKGVSKLKLLVSGHKYLRLLVKTLCVKLGLGT